MLRIRGSGSGVGITARVPRRYRGIPGIVAGICRDADDLLMLREPAKQVGQDRCIADEAAGDTGVPAPATDPGYHNDPGAFGWFDIMASKWVDNAVHLLSAWRAGYLHLRVPVGHRGDAARKAKDKDFWT